MMFEVATDSSRGKYKIEAREEFEILSKRIMKSVLGWYYGQLKCPVPAGQS